MEEKLKVSYENVLEKYNQGDYYTLEDGKVIGLNESFNIDLIDALMNEHDFTFEQATEIYNHLCKYGHSYGAYHIIEESKTIGGLFEKLLNIE